MENSDQLINSFEEINLNQYQMPIICIYSNPKDYRGMFVARIFDTDKPTKFIIMRVSLDAIRKEIPHGFTLMPKSTNDDSALVETWI
ncbi:hypothetical protein [Cytobacillus kochii]|uniref:hypothetical protein n=1 Tax=Cytobacillus kochii TaxID=859143 RepID=UPI0025A2DEC0|nr:hypothetical protein [Cytobacillus kochii]MDM5205751.1 hypothetical protein [Cytobacillus kochii]